MHSWEEIVVGVHFTVPFSLGIYYPVVAMGAEGVVVVGKHIHAFLLLNFVQVREVYSQQIHDFFIDVSSRLGFYSVVWDWSKAHEHLYSHGLMFSLQILFE